MTSSVLAYIFVQIRSEFETGLNWCQGRFRQGAGTLLLGPRPRIPEGHLCFLERHNEERKAKEIDILTLEFNFKEFKTITLYLIFQTEDRLFLGVE